MSLTYIIAQSNRLNFDFIDFVIFFIAKLSQFCACWYKNGKIVACRHTACWRRRRKKFRERKNAAWMKSPYIPIFDRNSWAHAQFIFSLLLYLSLSLAMLFFSLWNFFFTILYVYNNFEGCQTFQVFFSLVRWE